MVLSSRQLFVFFFYNCSKFYFIICSSTTLFVNAYLFSNITICDFASTSVTMKLARKELMLPVGSDNLFRFMSLAGFIAIVAIVTAQY